MLEPSTAELIIDMRRMYIGGASDEQLCSRGTEIYERLEKDRALAGNNTRKQGVIDVEQRVFEKIVKQIRDNRHKKALDAYDAFVAGRVAQNKKKN